MSNLSWWKKAYAVFALCAATAVAAPAQTLTTLVNFNGVNGVGPRYMSLAQGVDGNLYGTTAYGGRGDCSPPGCGTAFRITPGGDLATLSLIPADGSEPVAGMILAANDDFYGTAYQEGANDGGTVFEISKTGKLTVLYSFCVQTNCTDGFGPQGRLLQASDGSFYGTTTDGGASGSGTVFKIVAGGTLTTMYSFNGSKGLSPFDGLIEGTDGNFYGTTEGGGGGNGGTVFKITSGGVLTTLHNFGGSDGTHPYASLVQGTDGNFYGTTSTGGANDYGTVFKITPRGVLTTLYSFCSADCSDGGLPYAGLIQATDGNFYGTTYLGGNRFGTIFEITPQGTLTTLYRFCSQPACTDGGYPFGGLVQSTSGILYGTNSARGADRHGTVFSLDVGLAPFVAFIRPYGKVGQTGGILGQGLTGTTGVSINGVPASFTVKSDTYLTATVPAGATTGYVTVTTPSGVLTSNVPFRVLQ